MAVIETKYSIGDVVYQAGITTTRKQHPCPDCKGSRKWKAVSPAGNEYEFGCPRCGTQYSSFSDLRLDYTAHVPAVRRLTIGSIRHDSNDRGNEYMCCETGVGSGSIYREHDLFPTEEQARKAAEAKSALQDKELEWCAKLYDQSLSVSDYQLENAMLKEAKDFKSRAGSLLWNLNDLFGTIEEAADKDAILEAIADYKQYSWQRDLERVGEAA